MNSRSLIRTGNKSQGFTLIELLVVIAIIAILATILMPSLSVAKRLAKITACMSNLRNIGSAVHIYLTEHNQRFYEAYDGNGYFREFAQGGRPTEGSAGDIRPLNQYADAYTLFKCPADKGRDGFSALQPSIWDFAGCSYRFNSYGIAEKWASSIYNKNRNIANDAVRIQKADKFMVFGDFCIGDIMWGAASPGFVSGLYGTVGLGGSANAHEAFYDDPSSCVLFHDGHSDHLEDIKGIGGAGPNFYMLPDSDW